MKLKRRVSIAGVVLLVLLAAGAIAYADAVPLPKALTAFIGILPSYL